MNDRSRRDSHITKAVMSDLLNPIFTNADKAREALEAIRWPKGPICPHCGGTNKNVRLQGKSHRPGLYYCGSCTGHFTVTVGTVFERSKIPLNKWWLAAYLLGSSRKGMSARQLHHALGVTYKTAWFMVRRIREAGRRLPVLMPASSYRSTQPATREASRTRR